MAKDQNIISLECERLAQILRTLGSDALIAELKVTVVSWSPERLGELLIYLCSEGGTEWPSVLCGLGADPNFRDDEGQSPLSSCVHGAMTDYGQPSSDTFGTILELVLLGADPDTRYFDVSVISLALSWNQRESVCALLLSNPNLSRLQPDGETSLREVLSQSEHKWAHLLLKVLDQ